MEQEPLHGYSKIMKRFSWPENVNTQILECELQIAFFYALEKQESLEKSENSKLWFDCVREHQIRCFFYVYFRFYFGTLWFIYVLK